MQTLCPKLFSPASTRAAFMVFLAAASFAGGAMWASTEEAPAAMTVASLPVLPSADQVRAMNPQVPALKDNFDEAPPTF